MKKRIISLILSILIILSVTVTPTLATNIDNNASNNELFENQEYIVQSNSDISLDENYDCIPFEEIIVEIPIISSTNENTSTYAESSAEVFVLRGGLHSYSNGTFTWFFNIDCITSLVFKPDITVQLKLAANYTDGILFNNIAATCTQVIDSNIDYGKDYYFTTTARTGYYAYRYTITADDPDASVINSTTRSQLYNRTGHQWNFEFSDVDKELPTPRADYIKGQLYDRIYNLADIYYSQYEQETGIVLDKTEYQVHHIQPLAYGGDNSYDNLIHLPIDIHTSVTGWFNGY